MNRGLGLLFGEMKGKSKFDSDFCRTCRETAGERGPSKTRFYGPSVAGMRNDVGNVRQQLHRTKISPAKAISALFRKNAFLRFVNSINIALVSYQVRTSRRFSIHNEPSDSMNIQCTPFRFSSHRTAAVQATSAEL